MPGKLKGVARNTTSNGNSSQLFVTPTPQQPGSIDVNEFVNLTSTSAARLFNLYPRKGRIQVGSDADLVLWRQGGERQLAVEAHNLGVMMPDCANAFDYVESDAGPSVVVSRGKVVFSDDQVRSADIFVESILVSDIFVCLTWL